MMGNGLKSPDEVLLHCAGKAMCWGYTGFGINPLALQFWPVLGSILVSGLGFLHMSFYVDPNYSLVTVISIVWALAFWRDHTKLRIDSGKTWSADLFRQYGGNAALLRERTAWVRYLFLFVALVSVLVSFSDVSEDVRRLSGWQRCVFPFSLWVLVFLAYIRSAEPPSPDDGDLFRLARRA
jgi:hypothetical protein